MRTAGDNRARRQVSAPKSAVPLGSSFVGFRQGIPSPRTLPVNWRGSVLACSMGGWHLL